MIKKMLGVFTSVVAALAVVGVAWAGTDDGTSTSITAAGETSTSVSVDDSSSSTDATIASSTDATVESSTGATVDSSTSTSLDDSSSSTSTSMAATTSTSADSSSSTSTTVGSTTSTSTDRSVVPDGITVHTIPGVGSVTIEAALGQLILVDVSAPGWNVDFDKVESDRIELEFTSAAEAEAEFEARINDGRVEVRIEVD